MADEETGQARPGDLTNAIQMARAAQLAHHQLSQMADQKASILMATTFVIFTLAISQGREGPVSIPMLILGISAFAAAVLAVIAVLPKTHPQRAGEVNLLFFGSFAGLSRETYFEGMLEATSSDENVYRMMVNDIWQNGRLLARRKYRLLGYAFRIFLIGLTLSLIAFIVTLL